MPGWIIQAERGGGKSLAAVRMMREYLSRGCLVATNLDIFLDKLLPEDNSTFAYRLPDYPRLQDFELLGAAYDVNYKDEDKNGLLVLDEMSIWLNTREWNDKSRLAIIKWLILSRKLHWDLILISQDYELLDAQVRTTLCDYLVQATRLDRQTIPYLAPVLKFLGLNTKFPKAHVCYVYYGLSANAQLVEKWQFRGIDLYDAYNTNQIFKDGREIVGDSLLDMRATYTLLPASYLSGRVYTDRLENQISDLNKTINLIKDSYKDNTMAARKSSFDSNQPKIIILGLGLVIYLGYKFFTGGFSLPSSHSLASQPAQVSAQASVQALSSEQTSTVAIQSDNFIDVLLSKYKPRLTVYLYSETAGFTGFIDFYENTNLVERYTISELHSLGVSIVRRPYGADFLYKGKSYVLTAW